jgi:hypothetical protein
MDAILAIIADGGPTIIAIDKEAVEIIVFYFILLILLKPFGGGLVQPLAKRLPGVQYFCTSKPRR